MGAILTLICVVALVRGGREVAVAPR